MIVKQPIRHFINGKDLGEPRNWQDLEITVDWLEKKEGVNINITDLDFVLEAKRLLQERVLDGLSGGVGIFEGEPYQITIGDLGSPSYKFEGYLDFTDDATIIGAEEFSCSLKKRKGTDWLNEVADSFSFAYLADQGFINQGDYVKVPYVINYVPDGTQLILLSISLYMMTKETIENVQKLAETIADATDAAAPVLGASVGLGAGVVTAWDLGNFILVTLKTIARVAYIIAMTVAIINLIEEVFAQLLPKKRFHLGMRIQTLFERGCQYTGLRLQSNLLSQINDWVHVPSKDRKGGEDGESGHPVNSGPIYTFGDCIRVFKEMFNADYRIKDGIFYFERRDAFEVPSAYVIPPFFSDQERLLDVNTFNTDEMIANYNIFYAFDTQDQNTLDDQEGRVFQAITTPIRVKDQSLVNIKNLAQVAIPFSIGKTKNDLTRIEEVMKDLGKFVDKLTGVFGKGTNFATQIESRRGSMLLSSDFLTSGRIVRISGQNLTKDQRGDLGTRLLWDRYHFINSFADVNGEHNQYWRYSDIRVPMSLEDFEKVLDNNLATDQDGRRVEIETMTYRPGEGTAVIDFRVKRKYTNNLKIEYV